MLIYDKLLIKSPTRLNKEMDKTEVRIKEVLTNFNSKTIKRTYHIKKTS